MANPQWEDGYVKIANEVMDAFVKIRIPGEARQVLDFVIRKTWGFGKKADFISISQMSKATGLPKSSVFRALKNLLDTNLVTKKQRGIYEKVDTYITEWQFNKDYETWRVSTKKQRGIYEKVTKASTKKYTGVSTKKYTTKETNTKEILTKENNTCEFPSKVEPYSEKFETFWSVYPRKTEKKAAYRTWCTRIKNGVSEEDLIIAAENYASDCKARGADFKYIKHPKTFLGPDEPFRDFVKPVIHTAYNVYEQAAMSDPDEILQKMIGRTEAIIDDKRAGLGKIHNADEDDFRSDEG